MTDHPTIRVPAGAVLLAGDDVELVRWSLDLAQAHRRRNGLGPSRRVTDLLRVLGATSADMSESPGSDLEIETTREHKTMTINEAAAVLGTSARHARRLAPRLGGERIGGRWLLDAAAVEQHQIGATQ